MPRRPRLAYHLTAIADYLPEVGDPIRRPAIEALNRLAAARRELNQAREDARRVIAEARASREWTPTEYRRAVEQAVCNAAYDPAD